MACTRTKKKVKAMATCRMASRTIPAQMISSLCRRAKTQMVLREANKCDTSMTKTPADASNFSELIDIIIRQVMGGHHGTVRKPPRCQNSQASNFHTLTFPRGVQSCPRLSSSKNDNNLYDVVSERISHFLNFHYNRLKTPGTN